MARPNCFHDLHGRGVVTVVSCEIPEVERILEEFSRCANKVRTCTEVILRCVDEGCVPDQESIFSFQNELGLLQKQYDEMYAMAEEMPAISLLNIKKKSD